MAKFYGKIGFSETKETDPGIWEETIKEISYYGDITRMSSRYQSSGGVNDDIAISNTISIVSDPYAMNNFQKMKYVEYLNSKWKITNVEVNYPRLTLTIGGIYNE